LLVENYQLTAPDGFFLNRGEFFDYAVQHFLLSLFSLTLLLVQGVEEEEQPKKWAMGSDRKVMSPKRRRSCLAGREVLRPIMKRTR
jgi:hypothetical protein